MQTKHKHIKSQQHTPTTLHTPPSNHTTNPITKNKKKQQHQSTIPHRATPTTTPIPPATPPAFSGNRMLRIDEETANPVNPIERLPVGLSVGKMINLSDNKEHQLIQKQQKKLAVGLLPGQKRNTKKNPHHPTNSPPPT
jgi:hypothetical protein